VAGYAMMGMAQRTVLVKRFAPLAMQWGVTIYSAAVSLGLSVLFARSMGSAGFGHYTYIYVLASFLTLVQDAGFNTLLMRERTLPSAGLASHCRELPTIGLWHLLFTTALFVTITAVFHHWLDAPGLAAAIFCFATITLTQWQSSWFKGAGHFERDAVFLFAGRTVSALLVLTALLSFGASPAHIFTAWGVGLLLVLGCFRKDFPPLIVVPRKVPVWAYRSSVSFFALGLATTVYHHIDILLLRNILGEVPEIGHYAVATRVQDGVMLLSMPVALMLFRRMRFLATSPEGDNGFSLNAVLAAFGVGALLAVAGWLAGPWVIGLLFGSAYAEGSQTVVILLFAALIFALPNYVLEQSAIATQQERWFAGSLVFAVVVNVGLNLYLIPIKGVEGAAWATIFTEMSLCAVLAWGLRRKLF
jgi:O-antigen/teichoic acid export membrane protein